MQKIKSIIKKIGAISIGAAMLGSTMTGALAASLADYPTPFVDLSVKKYDFLVVVGSGATGEGAAADTIGATSVISGLSAAKVPGTSSGGTVSVSGGVSEDIPIGTNIAATNQVDKTLDDSDLSNFMDGTISFQGSDYDVSENLQLSVFGSRNTSVQTGIIGPYPDDDYKDGIVLVTSADAIKYYYTFDESIQVNKTKSSDPLEIKFLGKTLKVTSVDTSSKFTANVGAEYYLTIGDTITVNGKEVKLVDVGSGGNIIVTVGGVQDVVSADSTKTINGLEVKNDDTFYTDTKTERSAWLVVGADATESYLDGDAYVGEDEDDPEWVWDIGNLNTIGSTSLSNSLTAEVNASNSGPFIGVELDWDYRDSGDAEALEVGDCVSLPNNYASVCMDSLTVSDDDYMKLTFELAESQSLGESKLPGLPTTVDTINVKAGDSDGIKLLQSALSNLTKDKSTQEVWIYSSNSSTNAVFYKDKDNSNKKTYAGNVSGTGDGLFAQLVLGDTKDTNLQLNLSGSPGSNAPVSTGGQLVVLGIESIGDSTTDLISGTDHLYTYWMNASDGMQSLGVTKSSEEASETVWGYTSPGTSFTNIGTKDEDHRTRYGIIVKDPKSGGASDRVEFMIPGDQVQANVVVKGGVGGLSGTVSTGQALSTFAGAAPDAVLDTEVTNTADHNLILVGGPAVNRLSAQFLGLTYPAYGAASGLSPGEAILSYKANGEKAALIVAGWEAADTRRASTVLKNFDAYKSQFTGTEVKVTGTSSSPTIVSSA